MTDLPILFSAPMIRALLDGRKTMTRRILKPQPAPFLIDGKLCDVGMMHVEGDPRPRITIGRVVTTQQIRFAKGDRLWVREAAAFIDNSQFDMPSHWQYRADTNGCDLPGDWPADEKDNPERPRWRPSIHMPRVASRLTLLVKAVKIERLQDISEADAIAEGIELSKQFAPCYQLYAPLPGNLPSVTVTGFARNSFWSLWLSLHGVGAWDANPLVVAISFRVVKSNIDASEARIAA